MIEWKDTKGKIEDEFKIEKKETLDEINELIKKR